MSENTNTANSEVSREKVESIINNFLENKENYKVLALKGQWGVGKTYLVQNILSKHKQEFYYYASVFGISSIEFYIFSFKRIM
jgi:chromosomal replication initiation ATPase DnaA